MSHKPNITWYIGNYCVRLRKHPVTGHFYEAGRLEEDGITSELPTEFESQKDAEHGLKAIQDFINEEFNHGERSDPAAIMGPHGVYQARIFSHELPLAFPASETKFWVGVYLCDRAYGGPEEGGWWYDVGELSQQPEHLAYNTALETIEEANQVRSNIQKILDTKWNIGRHRYEIGSTLSNGQFHAEVHRGHLPLRYPETIPHYG